MSTSLCPPRENGAGSGSAQRPSSERVIMMTVPPEFRSRAKNAVRPSGRNAAFSSRRSVDTIEGAKRVAAVPGGV
jgi:hypothetical protein